MTSGRGRRVCLLFLIAVCPLTTVHGDRVNGDRSRKDSRGDGISAERLGTYRIDTNSITVSGLSAGAFFSVQMHVAHSKIIKGAGILAGGPFYCARGVEATALSACMVMPLLINVEGLVQETKAFAQSGSIDNPSNLGNTRVYLLSGTKDTVVVPGVMEKLLQYYSNFVASDHIKTKFDLPAQHSFVTDNYGHSCGILLSPFINNCGYDAADELLKWIYGNNSFAGAEDLKKEAVAEGNLITFDQSEFFSEAASMDSEGYAYIPSACKSNQTVCRLHFAFHGCEQGRDFIGSTFAEHTGYNSIAEKENIIVVYPQNKRTLLINPNGCMDWWGYTNQYYASKAGRQISGIKAMMDRIAGRVL